MSQSVTVEGREGFEHRVISSVPLSELRKQAEQLLEASPSEWSEDDMEAWASVCCEVERQADESRVFEIGDEAVLVGVEMTATNGAVGYRDEYNQNEIPVTVTGYNVSEDMWEVMITEETLCELIAEKHVEDEEWREFYLCERPANGGVTGYVITQRFRGELDSGHRKRGVYRPF